MSGRTTLRMLTTEEACQRLVAAGVRAKTTMTVLRWFNEGTLTGYQRAYRSQVWIDEESLDNLILHATRVRGK
jgi:hypothetical protein